jgi:UDP-N-acetylmuramoyl-L-alanyl-D-glutamate--2,6-diaminopimelate ligase
VAEIAELAGAPVPAGSGQRRLTGVTLDSRAVQPGDLYAALPGANTHGARFAADAASSGAAAVLTDPAGAELITGLPTLVVPDPRAVLGRVAAAVYGDPATTLTTYAVTGTNGKTTTTYLLDGLLRAAGRRTGLIGTVEIRVDDERVPSARTTPEAPDVQGLLALMVARGVTDLAMEVSSHALSYGRVDGIVFDVAGFTNLSQDHLDFHRTMEDYFAAKADLFTPQRARLGVIVVDDVWGQRLAKQATIPVVTISTADGVPADWRVTGAVPDDGGTRFELSGPGSVRVTARSPLAGDFNVANTALALVMMAQTGHDLRQLGSAGMDAITVPGRMQRVTGGHPTTDEPLAVVDYAHTPDAVAKALQALRPGTEGPLVVVLGAGGDRDRGKRPAMGAAAAQHADVVIITDDNPRQEDPAAIRAAVRAGVPADSAAEVLEIGDRRAAIAEGVRRAWGNGVLLVAGKGHESGQEVAGVVHPFDDRQVLAEALRSAGSARPATEGGTRRAGSSSGTARQQEATG